MKRNPKKFIIIRGSVCLLLLLLSIIMFRNISFGTDYIIINKINGNMKIGVPKYTFDFKESDHNISIKNFQSNKVVKKELKEILSKYEKITYGYKDYYNENDGYTIIDYGINNHFLFNTIYIKYVDYNYYNYIKLQEYGKKLGGSMKMHYYATIDDNNKTKFYISFLDMSVDWEKGDFKAELSVTDSNDFIEVSTGKFIIENDKLIYTRTEISKKSDEIKILETSIFTIVENGVFKLDDNYLSNYASEIILK